MNGTNTADCEIVMHEITDIEFNLIFSKISVQMLYMFIVPKYFHNWSLS